MPPLNEAQRKEAEDQLEILTKLLNDWKNEIPEQIVHSTDADNKWKARRSWLMQVLENSDFVEKLPVQRPDNIQRIIAAFKLILEDIVATKRATKPTDIMMGDAILTGTIKALQECLGTSASAGESASST